ncbi:hypothetical protein ABPG77_001875 [Micractinium sp. CCAP 211/92]
MATALRSSVLLLVATLLVRAQAAPKTVTVNWMLPPAKTNYALCSGDTLKITWSMASGNCSAKKALLLSTRSSGTWSKALSAGTYFFACQFASHCSFGLKIKVTVTLCSG